MRRGHARVGGWRNENPRHFRPRNGGNSYFRPSRQGFNSLDNSRFTFNAGPNPRHLSRPNAYSSRFDSERSHVNRSEESRYRTNRQNTYQNPERPYRHNDERQILPAFHKNRSVPERPPDIYNEQNNFYENTFENDYLHKNNMGDVDHRKIVQNRDNFRTSTISPWTNEARAYVHRNFNSHQRNDVTELNKMPIPEYSGHRPPSSDHYGCNPTISTIDKSNSFSRSVDDTVDIVRKRLLNRCEPNNLDNFESRPVMENQNIVKDQVNTELGAQEQPIKRRIQRQTQKDQSNCAKIKNKIVNQLFKMDKERIHKLMDNPNSSTKFEYAINSLITESQNSFNRHLRSVAEKCLCSSSDDFIQSDSNTIYEDTFMKQMQCILDPQDTILLEDIKPMVMAELNNILQLDNFDSVCEDEALYRQDEEIDYKPYHNDNTDIQNISFDDINEHNSHRNIKTDFDSIENVNNQENLNNNVQVEQSNYTEYWPLFERRANRKNSSTDITTTESQFHTTIDNMEQASGSTLQTQQRLFDTNSDHFSEDDTFAELDNQYHVAVDHDFIEQEDDSSAQHATKDNIYSSIIKTETSTQENKDHMHQIKKEVIDNRYVEASFPNMNEVDSAYIQSSKALHVTAHLDQERSEEPGNTYEDKKKSINVPRGTKSTSNSRKRSSDLRPSHRKEKRKKSDGTPTSESKQILNKNIIINVNDCANKVSEKCDAPKSIFNLFFSKEQGKTLSKDGKNVGTRDKYCSDKRIIKKEITIPPDDKSKKARKKNNSTSSNHSISPKDSNSSSTNTQTCKLDTKATLKTIDMFTEQPKKVNVHHSHRNTALTPKNDATKDNIENKFIDKVSLNKQFSKFHVAVQVSKKMHSKESQTFESKKSTTRFCQTECKTFAVKATQTDDKILHKPCTKAMDAFERMKEIDLEIQVLLQEKFKLYSSIESKESCTNSLQTLGMTVLDVSPFEDVDNASNINIIAENVIEDEFVNIPVEEFEQIVLERETQEQDENEKTRKKPRSRKTSSKSSQHLDVSAAISRKTSKKTKTPNISLIEQIITDERPLEEIISLDAFEIPSTKKGPKNRKMPKKKAVSNMKSLKINRKKYNIKECSVVLTRENFQKYIKDDLPLNINPQKESILEDSHELNRYTPIQNHVVEETVVNNIHFDMLDVSEDIVIGDVCEVKSDYDREVVETVSLPISEEVILDNSQSSMEEISAPLIEKGDECKVYDYSADENLQRDSILVSGNSDAVLAIECVENNFLAASLDGNVYYFNGDGKLISTLRGSNLAVTCLTIVQEKYGTTVYTGSLDSRIRYYDLETGLEKGPECNVLSPIQTMDRAWDTVFVGTRTGFVLQFECKNNMLIPVSTVKFSEQSILALKTMKEGPRKVLLVAARSENVTIKDAQTGLLLRSLAGPKMTVYSLLYADGKVYCGTSSHQIHVFEYTSGSHAGTHTGGKGAVCLRATGGFVFAGCYDGCVYVYREGESEPIAQLRGPSIMLLSLAIVGSKIIAGYKDRSLYIWKIPYCILQDMIL